MYDAFAVTTCTPARDGHELLCNVIDYITHLKIVFQLHY